MPTLDFSRNPDWGDSDATNYKLAVRRNLSNQLNTFKSAFWKEIDTYRFTVSAISESEVEEIIAFIQDHAGEQMTLVDYDGVAWTGVIIDDPRIVQNGPNDYAVDGNGLITFTNSCNFQITLMLEGSFITPEIPD